MKQGDFIKIEKKTGEVLKGILMSTEKKEIVVLKLDNGYNVGVDKTNIKKTELLEDYNKASSKPVKSTFKELKVNKSLPIISVLHTGGTIASKVDYRTGGVIVRFTPEELISSFPELNNICNIRSRLIANMWSEDMRFVHYKIMLDAIKEEIAAGTDGIIVTHGTDTLGYTAAALAFALANLPVPVILVGSQRSSDRGSTDAGMNLICAAKFLANQDNKDFKRVAICMHAESSDSDCFILPACKSRKLHTSRRDAFKTVNVKSYAKINHNTGKITWIDKPKLQKSKATDKDQKDFKVLDKFEEKVGIVRVHPNMFPENISCFAGYKGLIIEGTGLGQAPISSPTEHSKIHLNIFEEIKKLIASGTIVVMTSQCIFGRVHMHVYAPAIDLVSAGVIPGEDMLTETAFVKLAWLLGNYPKDKEKIKSMLIQNLRGEINPRIKFDDFL